MSISMETDSAANLRRGELVEVRSKDEILATLDERGELDGLVFMPEMLEFCGRRLRVDRRAHKTCDTITGDLVARRMDDCVHLEEARCDGSAHGGCQAGCLFFWKEAWLKRLEPARTSLLWRAVGGSTESSGAGPVGTACTEQALHQMAVQSGPSGAEEPRYRCQVTQLLDATAPLPWWEPMQYVRDWVSGNVPLLVLLRGLIFRMLYRAVRFGKRFRRIRVEIYNGLAKLFGEVQYPYSPGQVTGKTPSQRLDLQPGELVRVRPLEEILQTVNPQRRNRGLGFAPEMVRYCGGTFRVRSRVKTILDERTGKMMTFGNECIILEDVICRSECSAKRLFCPRSIYPYWREIWLERVDEQ